MARTFIAFDPRSGKREVIVEARPDLAVTVPSEDLERLKRRLYERHVHAGILITPTTAYFIRDTLTSLEFSPSSYEVQRLSTETLFSRIHGRSLATAEGLYGQVKVWLEAVAGSWSAFIPDEALPMMLPEMVGRLAEAQLEELDDVLEMEG